MKRIIRKLEKDILIKDRKGMGGIGFQDVQYAIEKGDILAKFKNDTPGYDSQFMFIVNIDGYPFKIPYKENDTTIELITAFPARKYKHLLNK